jgi:hypothetical protein
VPGFAGLFERKTFHEPLPDCTNQRWLDRFAAARSAHQALTEASRTIEDLARPGARKLYRELIAAVDGYAMAMSGFLVLEKHFEFDDMGKLGAPTGAIAACELRRKRANDLVAMLSDPKNDTPVFEESVTFDELAPEHRKSFIHRWEARLEQEDQLPVRGNWLPIALRSDYDFDRIAAYLYKEKRRPSGICCRFAIGPTGVRTAANSAGGNLYATALLTPSIERGFRHLEEGRRDRARVERDRSIFDRHCSEAGD